MTLEKLIKNYNLSLTLLALFLISWIGQWHFQWQEFVMNQEEHGQIATIEDFIPEFGSRTMENWQSEFLQLLTFVVLSSFMSHKGSPESKDSEEKTEKSLERIEKKIGTKKSNKKN